MPYGFLSDFTAIEEEEEGEGQSPKKTDSHYKGRIFKTGFNISPE